MEVQLPRARQRAGRAGHVSYLLLLPCTPSMVNEMPTALPDWTTERPDVPGFYWWMVGTPEVVRLDYVEGEWAVFLTGHGLSLKEHGFSGVLWWPVRIEHPPVG